MTPVFTVAERGVGKPDYSRHVSSGYTRPGFTLEYNQTLLIFVLAFSSVILPGNPFPWMLPSLAIGATEHLINAATGAALPYTINPGYKLTMVSVGYCFDQDMESWQWLAIPTVAMGGTLFREACAAQLQAGIPLYLPEVVAFSSEMIDPTFTIPMDYDLDISNVGGAVMQGEAWFYYILEAVGTPPLPPVKEVVCKHCGNKTTVPTEQTMVICSKCGKLTMYRPLAQLKGRAKG